MLITTKGGMGNKSIYQRMRVTHGENANMQGWTEIGLDGVATKNTKGPNPLRVVPLLRVSGF